MMNQTTLRALKNSIQHWEENLESAKKGDWSSISTWAEHCALCEVFYGRDCRGCPVKTFECADTPYVEVVETLRYWQALRKACPTPQTAKEAKTALRQAIKAELEFLKSLLPEGND